MNREQLAHVLRAASQVAGADDIVVIGSQSILGSYDENRLPREVTASHEVDVAFMHDPTGAKWQAVDGALGEASPFDQTYGYYGQGVETSTATLPNGWWNRLVDIDFGTGRALEAHDLAAAKLAAGREKDYPFVAALLDAGLIHADVLVERIDTMDISSGLRQRMLDWLGMWRR